MSEMVDRVAKALDKCGQERGSRIPTVMLRHFAAAAIAAMREPTEAVLRVSDGFDGGYMRDEISGQVWRQQIDAALE